MKSGEQQLPADMLEKCQAIRQGKYNNTEDKEIHQFASRREPPHFESSVADALRRQILHACHHLFLVILDDILSGRSRLPENGTLMIFARYF